MPNGEQERVDVELKATFLEQTVETLNEVVIEQGRIIEDLERRLGRLEALAKASLEGRSGPVDPLDERPPHY